MNLGGLKREFAMPSLNSSGRRWVGWTELSKKSVSEEHLGPQQGAVARTATTLSGDNKRVGLFRGTLISNPELRGLFI